MPIVHHSIQLRLRKPRARGGSRPLDLFSPYRSSSGGAGMSSTILPSLMSTTTFRHSPSRFPAV